MAEQRSGRALKGYPLMRAEVYRRVRKYDRLWKSGNLEGATSVLDTMFIPKDAIQAT